MRDAHPKEDIGRAVASGQVCGAIETVSGINTSPPRGTLDAANAHEGA
jgi:hypothetical protein